MAQNRHITDLLLNISAQTLELNSSISKAKTQLTSFKSSLGGIGKAMGAAFSVAAVISFTKNASRMAAEMEGVEQAFKRLGNSTELMNDLKKATNGTVSEFELMKQSVQAANFGISLQELPQLLEFATKKAQATGESVDYLVNSIVTGMGRQSVQILDNLGISATALREEIAKTGDFMTAVGNIVNHELATLPDHIETSITATDRLNASWDNFVRVVGKAINETGALETAMNSLSTTLDFFASEDLKWWEKLWAAVDVNFGMGGGLGVATWRMIEGQEKRAREEAEKTNDVRRQALELAELYGDNVERISAFLEGNKDKAEIMAIILGDINKKQEEQAKKIVNIVNLQEKVKELEEQRNHATGDRLLQLNREIEATRQLISDMQKVGTLAERLDIVKRMSKNTRTEKGTFTDTEALPTMMPQVNGLEIVLRTLEEANASYEKLYNTSTQFMTLQQELGEAFKDNIAGVAVNAINGLGNALGRMFTQQEAGFKSVVLSVLSGIRQIITALMVETMAHMIKEEVKTKGILGLITAGVGIGLVTALFSSLPSFERGGMHKGGLRLVGESGPEIEVTGKSRIFNAAQTKNILSGIGSSSSNSKQLVAVVTGEQIKFVLDETNRRRGI